MKENQMHTPILDAIEKLIDTNTAYFRIPGHRLSQGMSERWTSKVGTQIFAYDVTETPYTDDLHCPEGAILEAQQLYASLYQVDESFLLVNGTTCGNEAMILSAALEKEEILVARNAHKSAMMGLILSGAKPVYIMPEVIADWGLQGCISPSSVRKAFQEHPDAKAFFLVSPSYYGITSDLAEIVGICHEFGAMLLVDEAHGAHVYFHEALPTGAMAAGADMCVQSMHKVTGALTQSSVLHLQGKLVNRERVAKNLHLVQSTSPNYLLMSSLDCARYELARNGKEMMQNALELAAYAREQINQIEGFRCLPKEIESCAGLDETRIVISAKEIGLTGYELEEMLFDLYHVNVELSDYQNVLAIVTYANTRKDMEQLIQACFDISDRIRKQKKPEKRNVAQVQQLAFPPIPEQVYTPREAYFAQAEEISWNDAVGRVSAEMIAPYPPGIPVIYPGERITREIWDYLQCFKEQHRHIHGSRDGKLNQILVIK